MYLLDFFLDSSCWPSGFPRLSSGAVGLFASRMSILLVQVTIILCRLRVINTFCVLFVSVIHASVWTHADYCNSLLVSLTKYPVSRYYPSDCPLIAHCSHVSTFMNELPWLPISVLLASKSYSLQIEIQASFLRSGPERIPLILFDDLFGCIYRSL